MVILLELFSGTNDLDGTIPTEIGMLTELTFLSLGKCVGSSAIFLIYMLAPTTSFVPCASFFVLYPSPLKPVAPCCSKVQVTMNW